MKVIIPFCLFVSLNIYGSGHSDGHDSSMNAQEKKQKVLMHLDKRISRMKENSDKRIKIVENAKSCVNGANEKTQIKECKKKMRMELKAIREDNRMERKERWKKSKKSKNG